MSLSLDDALGMYQQLPQFQHIPKERFINWYKQLQIKGERVDFHLRRARCVGGSEIGAIINWYFKDVASLPTADGFKTLPEIAREKLFLDLPYSTKYTSRGIGIEPFIRRAFEIQHAHKEFSRDQDALDRINTHKNNQFMGANPDDIFTISDKTGNTKRILIDYKSSVEEYQETPYRQIAQLNHYDEVGRSEGIHFDAAFIVGLHTSEEIFKDLIRFTEHRKTNPQKFEQWAQIVASEEMQGIKIKVYPVKLDPQLGKLCSQVSKRFMDDFPLQGKVPGFNNIQTVLNESELQVAQQLEGNIFHLSAMKKSVENLETALNHQIKSFVEEVGDFEWPAEFPVRYKKKEVMDISSAISFVKSQGFNENDYTVKAADLDTQKLIEKIEKLGGTISIEDYENKVSKEKILALLEKLKVESSVFVKNVEVSFELSRSSKVSDFIQSTEIQIQEELLKISQSMTENELNQINQNSQMNMG